MERPEKLDGLQVSPAPVPRFQAYLRQRLVSEHQRRRLRRSQRAWMCTAIGALAVVGFGVAYPRPVIRAHYALFPTKTLISGPEYALVDRRGPHEEVTAPRSLLAQTVAASLEQDRVLAARLGGRGLEPGRVLPERAFVVSRFPLPDGREVQVYTSLFPEQDEVVNGALLTSEGGTW